jgi:2-amino-4-hydroxy-6-hydroxymethyldihydropteridine diphosphokinase
LAEKYLAILLLGTNQGNKKENLFKAIELLAIHTGTIKKASSLYATEPWGLADQAEFLNQAVILETELSPAILLQKILNIEQGMGRRRELKWGPRLIDIDILDFAGIILNTPELKLPHPYLQERRFSLLPLQEINPEWVHPVLKKTAEELLFVCPDHNAVNRII